MVKKHLASPLKSGGTLAKEAIWLPYYQLISSDSKEEPTKVGHREWKLKVKEVVVG